MEGERSMSIAATLQKHLSSNAWQRASSFAPETGMFWPCCPLRAGSAARNSRWELGENFALASENELEQLFEDCVAGAVPPVGEAYGLDAVVEPSISGQRDLYFEGGDHATLVHVTQPSSLS
jgi:Ala-tRNA(Pro) deacylase